LAIRVVPVHDRQATRLVSLLHPGRTDRFE
jgi:hypothetical protein